MLPSQRELIHQWHQAYFQKLYLYANAVLKDPERAMDVVQDTFHEAVRRINDIDGHENPAGWLMKTLKYKIRESERRRLRFLRHCLSLDSDLPDERAYPDRLVGELPEPPEPGLSPLERIEKALTPEEYHLLKRLILDGASHLEVARELGISVYASEKRLERIRDKLAPLFPGRRRKKEK